MENLDYLTTEHETSYEGNFADETCDVYDFISSHKGWDFLKILEDND